MPAAFKVREQVAFPLGVVAWLGFCLLADAAPEVCVEFGELPLNSAYVVSNRFVSGNVTCEVERFQWRDGRWTSNGNARVEGSGLLNIGAQLPYLWLNN